VLLASAAAGLIQSWHIICLRACFAKMPQTAQFPSLTHARGRQTQSAWPNLQEFVESLNDQLLLLMRENCGRALQAAGQQLPS